MAYDARGAAVEPDELPAKRERHTHRCIEFLVEEQVFERGERDPGEFVVDQNLHGVFLRGLCTSDCNRANCHQQNARSPLLEFGTVAPLYGCPD